MFTSSTPKPVQIVATSNDGSLKLKDKALKQLLCSQDVQDKTLCVLSVAGAFRKGKSFLLDFILRFLEQAGSEDWLHDRNQHLEGFSWTGGCSRDTSGIWAWKKLFTLPNCPKVLIMVMDTQGLFDNETTMKGSAAVFGLSTLVSSIQVYNLSQIIHEVDLQHLQLFTEYGKLAKRESESSKPFQSLVFLIRDWPHKVDYKFGEIGGTGYLKKIMSSKGEKELQKVRNHIFDSFEDVRCFLMPYPGKKVHEESFKGQLKDIEKEFITNLNALVKMLLPSQKLVVKKNNGKEMTCKQVFRMFEMFGGDKPYANETNLLEEYHKITAKALQNFCSTPKMGRQNLKEQFQKELVIKMEEEFEKYRRNNNNKLSWYLRMGSFSSMIPALVGAVSVAAMFGAPEVGLPIAAISAGYAAYSNLTKSDKTKPSVQASNKTQNVNEAAGGRNHRAANVDIDDTSEMLSSRFFLRTVIFFLIKVVFVAVFGSFFYSSFPYVFKIFILIGIAFLLYLIYAKITSYLN